MDSEQLGVL